MTAIACDWCGGYIEVDNRRFPGFCTERCREEHRGQRDRQASALARSRRDARQHRAVTEGRERVHHLT